MALDSKIALVSDKTPEQAKHFDHWVRLSTLEKRKPVYVPIKHNDYCENIPGTVKKFLQVNVSEAEVSFSFVKDVPANKDYLPETPKLSLDLSFATLFASVKGDLFAERFSLFFKNMMFSLRHWRRIGSGKG